MIDVMFDFTTDTPGYWDENKKRLDPDFYSPTLKMYHKELWSRELPNGEVMELEMRKAPYYLTWKDFDFGSDSIIVEMKYPKNQKIINQVYEKIDDPDLYYENLLRKSYTIGGMVIFPRHRNSMNAMRGMLIKISDRWDMTLECIRRYYNGEDSPLYKTICSDKEFFDLFVDFKGYVDFFFMQDMVSEDYSIVDCWCGDFSFEGSGLPKTVDEYFKFIELEHEFLKKRNARIKEFCNDESIV